MEPTSVPNTGVSLDIASSMEDDARVWLCGAPIHNLALDQVFERIDVRVRSRQHGYIVTPNVDHICKLHRDHAFLDVYRGAFLSLADGVPVIWASRLLGKSLAAKLSGSDMVYWLSEHAAKKGYSIFLLGGAEGVAKEAGERLQRLYPGLQIAGAYSPPFGFEHDAAQSDDVISRVKGSGADICYVALGAPKQEFWMREHGPRTGVPIMIGIGASLDFVTGKVKRAPRLLQRIGLEWLWRLAQEPRRMIKRYLVDDSVFFLLVWREFCNRFKRRTN